MDATRGVQTIAHSEGLWRALHDSSRVDGPAEVLCGDDCLAQGITFHLDDYTADLVLSDRFRACRRGGTAVVETAGHLPFGAEVGVSQVLRYAANHVRGVTDVAWPAGAAVRQCLGLVGLFLPGAWRRVFLVPPCGEQAAGATAGWEELPAVTGAPVTVRQWPCPPLALVFERIDGARFEVGTGGDVWRWEHCLGCGPAAGRYAVVAEPGGIRVLRAPLAPARAVEPERRRYRLSWYLAWQSGRAVSGTGELSEPVRVRFSAQGEALVREAAGRARCPALLLDLRDWPCLAHARRLPTPAAARSGVRSGAPCWASAVAQKAFRRVIRQVASLGPEGTLRLRGLAPGPCWDPGHWERRGEPLPHWDLDGLLNLGEWGRQQLGPGWQVTVEAPGWEALPSVAGLFAPTGFRAADDEAADA
jgi:hypothetical protein